MIAPCLFSFLHRHKPSPAGLLTSRLFDDQSFYRAFIHDLNRCSIEATIESPFITRKRVAILMPTLRKLARQGVKVTVTTRHPNEHETVLRIQAWMAIKELRLIGAKVRFSSGHHRKLAILDGRILWEGSLNILSQCKSREIMRRIESEDLAKEMTRYLRLGGWFGVH